MVGGKYLGEEEEEKQYSANMTPTIIIDTSSPFCHLLALLFIIYQHTISRSCCLPSVKKEQEKAFLSALINLYAWGRKREGRRVTQSGINAII